MKSVYFPICLLACLSVTTFTGCKTMSQAAFMLGQALDPDRQCQSSTTCPLCAEEGIGDVYPGAPTPGVPCAVHGQPAGPTPAVPPGYVGQAGGEPPQLLAAPQSNTGNPPFAADAAGANGGITNPLAATQAHSELMLRNNELINARRDYLRMQKEIAKVRYDMETWQDETRQIREKLHHAELRRGQRLNSINDKISGFVQGMQQQ